MSRLLAGASLLVVSGMSGAGKSSLLRAGMLPRIRAAGLTAAPGAATRSPYRGLAMFGEPDAGWFFGREAAATIPASQGPFPWTVPWAVPCGAGPPRR